MKIIEFETSKGKFKLIDMPETIRINGWNGSVMIDELNQISQEKYAKGFYLKNITEEQASEIVDEIHGNISFITTLNILLKSKGIHLYENPVPEPEYQFDNFGNGGMCESWINVYQEQAQKTFYNPYIFKL